jgi:hypothetical protein
MLLRWPGIPATRPRLRFAGNLSAAVGFGNLAGIICIFAMSPSVPADTFSIEPPKPLPFLLHITHIGKIGNIFAAAFICVHFVTSKVTPLEYLLRRIWFKNLHDV